MLVRNQWINNHHESLRCLCRTETVSVFITYLPSSCLAGASLCPLSALSITLSSTHYSVGSKLLVLELLVLPSERMSISNLSRRNNTFSKPYRNIITQYAINHAISLLNTRVCIWKGGKGAVVYGHCGRENALHHTAPDCTTLHQTAPDCTRLHQTAPDCTRLHQTASHFITLHHTTSHYIALQHNTSQ